MPRAQVAARTRPLRVDAPARGVMRELETLRLAAEHHRVVADFRTAAQRRKADGAGLAGPRVPVARADLDILERDAAPARRRLAERERRARGRVDLVAVMDLGDLDIELDAELRRDLLGQRKQQIDRQAHIGRPHDRRALGRGRDGGILCGIEPGRADHQHLAQLRRQGRVLHARRRRGEIDDRVAAW